MAALSQNINASFIPEAEGVGTMLTGNTSKEGLAQRMVDGWFKLRRCCRQRGILKLSFANKIYSAASVDVRVEVVTPEQFRRLAEDALQQLETKRLLESAVSRRQSARK